MGDNNGYRFRIFVVVFVALGDGTGAVGLDSERVLSGAKGASGNNLYNIIINMRCCKEAWMAYR